MVVVFVKAQEGPPNVKEKETDKDIFTVQYFDDHGNMTIRSEGSVRDCPQTQLLSKIGSKEPENRQKLSLWTVSMKRVTKLSL